MSDPVSSVLIQNLQDPSLYDHPVESFQLLQTHISWLLLTGPYAYKIKKPLNLGFLDFSTLEKRRFYCHEELRLNRRLAPGLYLEVVTITGSPIAPRFGGGGPAIEYAVKMVQFPQAAQIDRVLERGELLPRHIDNLSQTLAEFHRQAALAGPDSPFGTPQRVHHPVAENFIQIRERVADPADLALLEELEAWSETTFERLQEGLAARKQDNFIRECHGDVHLGNMVLLDDQVVIFDCLEFNENLRWIDVVNELAFLIMDLHDRQQFAYAARVLNGYLEATGDYAGLPLLAYYQTYRAMVRAKVASIRLLQPDLNAAERQAATQGYRGYLSLAQTYTHSRPAPLIITYGLSGSGKSRFTEGLLERLGAVRVRSDVERKRLHDLPATARSGSALHSGLYGTEATEATYARLAEVAEICLQAGFPCIVDATFLKQRHRAVFRELAARRGVAFTILDFQAPEEVLRRRIVQRTAQGTDASEADLQVLDAQLAAQEPLNTAEREQCLVVEAAHYPTAVEPVLKALRARLSGD